MTEQSGSADGRSLTTNLKDLGNVVKDDYRGRGGEAPHRDEIKAQYNDVKSTVGDQAGQLKEEAKNRAPDAQELKGRAKEEADARTGGQASGYQQKAVDAKNSRKSQSQDEDGALADKLPEDMVAKVADMLSNVLGNGKLFEEYVGQSAWMAELVTKGMSMKKKKDKVKEIAKQAPEKIQQEREVVLLKLLQTRLAQYHEGDHEGFRSHVAKEAKDLARLPFGVGMLHSIGYMYRLAGQQHGGVGSKVSAFFKGKAHQAGKSVKDDISKVNLGMMYLDIRGLKDKKTDHTSYMEVADYLEKRVGWVLTHLWNLMTEDVEHTLRNVTKLLFDREEGGKSHTKSLSQALLIIGEEFGSVSHDADGPHMPQIPALSGGGGGKRNPELDQSGQQAGEKLGQKADQGAQKANQGIDQGAQRIQEEAGPRAKQFTDEQMMPAANKVAEQARPQADKFNEQAIDPAARAVEQNARPLADKAINQGIQPGAQAIAENAVPMTDKFIESGLRPGAETVANKAKPVAAELMQNQVLPRMKDGEGVDVMAQRFTDEQLMPTAKGAAKALPKAADDFNAKLEEQTNNLLRMLQDQIEDIEREGPGVIKRLPEALNKAVARNAVPDDLERDVLALANWIEPQIPKLVEKAKHAQDSMDKLNDKAGSALDQVQTNVSKGANKASEQIVPLAQDASNQINSAAGDLSKEVGPNADKLNAKVMEAADKVSKNAVGYASNLEDELRFQAKDAQENAGELGDVLSDRVRSGADTVAKEAPNMAGQAKQAVSQGADRVAEEAPQRAQQAGEGLQDTANKAAEKAPEVAGKAKEGVNSTAQQTKEKAPQAGAAAGEKANSAALGGQEAASDASGNASSTLDKMRKGEQW